MRQLNESASLSKLWDQRWLTAIVLIIFASNGCSMLVPKSRSLSQFMDGTSDDDQFALARLKEKRGDYDDALRIYQKNLKTDPQHRETIHRIGVVSMKKMT